jgi:hypothetical protein
MLATESIELTRREFQVVEEEAAKLEAQVQATESSQQEPAARQRRMEKVAEVLHEFALASLDYLPRLQRLWRRIECVPGMELGKCRQGVKTYCDLLGRIIKHLDWVVVLDQKGYHVKAIAKVRRGLLTVQRLKNRAEELLAWLNKPTPAADPAALEESRRAYEAGDYQDLGEVARGLQGARNAAGES